jgi:hypothetical protein
MWEHIENIKNKKSPYPKEKKLSILEPSHLVA